MGARDFTRNRSDRYQYAIVEFSAGEDLAKIQEASRPLYSQENLHRRYIMEKIHDRYLELIQTKLTEIQRAVLELAMMGMTQTDIGKFMNSHQSSITKSMFGNVGYNTGKGPIRYGGAKRKLQKAAAKDEVLQKLFAELAEIDE